MSSILCVCVWIKASIWSSNLSMRCSVSPSIRHQQVSNTYASQKYSVITTDFDVSGEKKYSEKGKVLKDNNEKHSYDFESIKEKIKYNNNNNSGITDRINDNCTSCLTETNTTATMSTNNIMKVNISIVNNLLSPNQVA